MMCLQRKNSCIYNRPSFSTECTNGRKYTSRRKDNRTDIYKSKQVVILSEENKAWIYTAIFDMKSHEALEKQ